MPGTEEGEGVSEGGIGKLPRVLEGKSVNFLGVTSNFAAVHTNRGAMAFVRLFMVTQDCRGQQTEKNAPADKDWEVSDVAALGKAFGKELTT